MKVLVVGSGGREHALCWAISNSPLCDKLYCAPGNAGIADVAALVPIGSEDVDALVRFVQDNAIDFVVVGPEGPLVLGLVDRLTALGVKAFGPSAAAAELEGSKGFMKDILAKYGVPTAFYERFKDPEAAKAYVRKHGAPIVVKADGLAAGKGVTVARSEQEAFDAIDDALVGGRFGAAGAEVVVEEFLDGEEVSFFALCDGENALPLASAQDHKAVGDGDTGPNTGGMGAYSPAPVLTPDLQDRVMREIILPTVKGMAAEGKPFKGVLFAGLMIMRTPDGPVPKTLEFNVRFGDPECQTLMMRLKSDALAALVAAADGVLDSIDLRWHEQTALCVVMAASGYPGDYAKNTEIRGLDKAGAVDGVTVFHAGTKRAEDGRVLSVGGRVLGVTALAPTVAAAQTAAYKAVDALDWPDGFCRRDIGWRAVGR
ncbi:phosphoribosylamine--glycine ligase [Azospirillum lipoferum]|uniref:Phosphoribosylamine--glycine ligase n=1 Tax=Azospirillum lipoferum TaxID=193 RepID=A0A5A9GXU3_AZOLI|nr:MULTISPECIES: phosphoribosylamine--glycine ligase [Azospirillum]KAA0598404.1 phosphoribosylamine--glycine ligase [Azospirillum lipoferum]MCP1609603.1 phosphoribosylamine--glycine ligase [Azospirillum lipoferum]MDW5535089.1 phosphoribosylamine--glycine ligase [Azospirillum sp. NL1]